MQPLCTERIISSKKPTNMALFVLQDLLRINLDPMPVDEKTGQLAGCK